MTRYPSKKTGHGVRNAVAACAAASLLAVSAAASAGVIKVGVSLRMKTETGEKYGQMVVDEFEAINAAGGVNGHTFEVKLLNDECKSDIGVANATKFAYQDNVHLFIGSSCSSVSLPIVDVLHKAGVPMLIPHSTNYKITLKGSPWVFRVPISSRFSAAAAAKYTAENIGTKIAYIWASDAASQADAQKFYEYIETYHGEPPVYAEQFQEGELDLRAHLLKIKALGPEALMISAQSQDFARGLVQSYEVGIPPSVKRIGGSAASNRPAPILSGDAIKGVFFHAAFSYADPDPKVKEFVKMTGERYGVPNPDHDFSQAWDSVHVARIAIEGADLTLTDRHARRGPGGHPGRPRDRPGLRHPRRRGGRLLRRRDARMPGRQQDPGAHRVHQGRRGLRDPRDRQDHVRRRLRPRRDGRRSHEAPGVARQLAALHGARETEGRGTGGSDQGPPVPVRAARLRVARPTPGPGKGADGRTIREKGMPGSPSRAPSQSGCASVAAAAAA